MAYQCIKERKECDGCGTCKGESPSCPNCRESAYEKMYYMDEEWIGCDGCISRVFTI